MDFSNRELLYRIVCARDKRYDGRFYCGVRTTGIYCRPICPARPKLANIAFYRSSAEAEKAGYRACKRCRPDLAPTSVQWNGTAAVVGRALSMISRGEADNISLDRLATRLGITDRHLRRLFDEHVGASPVEVANSKRLHLAKQLLAQSNLPVTEVAFASGYKSIRRFNDAFKDKFKAAPSEVRKSTDQLAPSDSNLISVDLPIIGPFDWGHIYGFLERHGIEGVESFTDGRYQRSVLIDGHIGAIDVGYDSEKSQLTASISIEDAVHLRGVIERIRDIFDARMNPHAHLDDLDKADPIAKCYRSALGLRIPGSWDPFETAVCIILGQLVSVEQARNLVKKLVAEFGRKITKPVFEGCSRLFPGPRDLMNADLKMIGITKVRENALRELSRLVAEGGIDLSRSANLDETKTQLLSIKGIGPWTAEMIAMRCLGDSNAFPATDLIIKRALQHHKVQKGDWSPWNSYVALAIWKKYAKTLSKKSTPCIE